MTQIEVMSILKAHPGESMTALQISTELKCANINVQYYLKKMFQKGCIEREDGPPPYKYRANNGIR